MVSSSERLPDSFYSEEERWEYLRSVLIDGALHQNRGAGYIVVYHLFGAKGNTGKVMLLAVGNLQDGVKAIEQEYPEMRATIGKYAMKSGADYVVSCLHSVLSKYRYVTKWPSRLGADRVYTYNELIGELVDG